ncbi:MAG: hypothetical protein ACH37H_13235 [Ilumatobacteraceae bacterium]
MQPAQVLAPPVPLGPRAYRRRIRRLGPIAGLLPPAALGATALLLLHDNTSTVRGVLGFLVAVLAAPGLLVAGAPMAGSTGLYVAATAGSAAMWLLIGAAATARATRSPVATWRDFWKEHFWLAGAVWLGVVGALVAANLILGGAFL